jgi:hypothetical protein
MSSSSGPSEPAVSSLVAIKEERKTIAQLLHRSPILKNPVVFMILLDCIALMVTIVGTVHIKTKAER